VGELRCTRYHETTRYPSGQPVTDSRSVFGTSKLTEPQAVVFLSGGTTLCIRRADRRYAPDLVGTVVLYARHVSGSRVTRSRPGGTTFLPARVEGTSSQSQSVRLEEEFVLLVERDRAGETHGSRPSSASGGPPSCARSADGEPLDAGTGLPTEDSLGWEQG
jgi:hypothetical protein